MTKYSNIKSNLGAQKVNMNEDSRQIRLAQRQVEELLSRRSEILLQKTVLDVASQIQTGTLELEHLDPTQTLELAESLDQVANQLSLSNRDYSEELQSVRRSLEIKILKQIREEIKNNTPLLFDRSIKYFRSQNSFFHLFRVFDNSLIQTPLHRMRQANSKPQRNRHLLNGAFEDFLAILELSAALEGKPDTAPPSELVGKHATSSSSLVGRWGRDLTEKYCRHFFKEVLKRFLGVVLENANVKNDRTKQQHFLENLLGFDSLFKNFEKDIKAGKYIDAVMKEAGVQELREVIDDYYEMYFGVEDRYIKNISLIYSQLMQQELKNHIKAIGFDKKDLGKDDFLILFTERGAPMNSQRRNKT